MRDSRRVPTSGFWSFEQVVVAVRDRIFCALQVRGGQRRDALFQDLKHGDLGGVGILVFRDGGKHEERRSGPKVQRADFDFRRETFADERVVSA